MPTPTFYNALTDQSMSSGSSSYRMKISSSSHITIAFITSTPSVYTPHLIVPDADVTIVSVSIT